MSCFLLYNTYSLECSLFLQKRIMAANMVVSPFLGVLFDNISTLIHKEVGLVWGADKEMKKLVSTLSTIRDVLEDAEQKQVTSKAVANWLLKLRDLAYDADDLVDGWETEARQLHLGTDDITCSKQVFSYLSSFSYAQVLFRRKIANRVNVLREKFDQITLEKSCFDLRVGVAERRIEKCPNRETSSLLTDPNVYGRDEERDFIVGQILSKAGSGEGVSVHPIVGIGGLGKTTLAQVCYNDHRVQKHFDVKIWVCVSDDFDMKRLTRAVINSITGGTCNLEDLDPLQRNLQEKLAQKRFLLVLDDVWNEDQEEWSKFKNSLRCGAVGSSVIVTTRLNTVASIVGTRAPMFLKLLSEDNCWSLFRQRAFGMGTDEGPNFVKVGQEIVKKCRGVPLAAKVLGGLVRFKQSEKEWLNIRDSRIWELPQSDGNNILPALRLSYTHLAPQLRQCFAYCSVFPKDHRIGKDELIQLWMANGFIQSKEEMQMEDIGNEIFSELSWRLFFQDEEKNSDGLVVSCMMHDLMHDLACSINMKECYHLAEGTQIRNVHLRMRHLSINRATESYAVTDSIHQLAPNLRTLMLLNYDCDDEPVTGVCLTSLRAFSLKQAKPWTMRPVNWKLLDSLGNMKHLRYLNISYSKVRLLPDSLCKLVNLQTLELEGCNYLEKLPKHTGNMSSLRHINIKGCSSLKEMPVGMGKLICLQTLSFFIVGPSDGWCIKELQGLDYLSGHIEIKGLEHVKTWEGAKEANLIRKRNIVSLRLVWSNVDADAENRQRDVLEGLQPHPHMKRLMVDGYTGLTLPRWLDSDLSSSLPDLDEITINDCSRCEHVPSSLGLLPLLRRLVIWNVNRLKFFVTKCYNDMANAFPSLEFLVIKGMEELEDWFPYGTGGNSISKQFIHQFPCLKKLSIEYCPKLKRLPPSSLSSLETLYLVYCNPTLLGSVQNLPRLSYLHISFLPGTTCFPEEGLQNLPSLKSLFIVDCDSLQSLPLLMGCSSLTKLHICDCPRLTNVSQGLRYQTSLQSLSIEECPKAEISAVEYKHLNSLQVLVIGGINDMETLPDGIQYLSSTLQRLHIYNWNSLPDWIGSFTNLKSLRLEFCKNLTSLPDGLQQITNLQKLEIWGCHPELHRRCEQETGEDWPKIKHIPNIDN